MCTKSDIIVTISTIAFLGIQAYICCEVPIAWFIEVAALLAISCAYKTPGKETDHDASTDI